jgi:hypothetical protein
MGVVTASVFDTGKEGFVRDIDCFVDRESVHVGTESDDRPGLCTFEKSDDAVFGDVRFDIIDAKRPQSVRDNASRAFFTVGKLRVHV